ncbi:MAG: glycosyltransferase family 2 protein [Candidatus Marinimicrobia bacterium]|nr:glycosyltransferase family 2 protein [Candidatus Neomarinimicrobiota bacterium]
MHSPRICILVLNWNGANDTIDCVQSLKGITYPDAEIVVIDNGSTDDSVRLIESAHRDVKMIELESNLFYGGGNNAGLHWAQELDFDYVMFLNNDTTVEPDFLEPLLEGFESSPQVGMVAPLMCYAAEPDLIWYAGGVVNLWTGVVEHRHIRKNIASLDLSLQKTDYVTGCCLMMPTVLLTQLGGFDPSFNMYGEDVDLSLRTRAAGYDLLFVPESKIFHKVSASVGGEFSLKKMRRKLAGLFRLYSKFVKWYQWPVLVPGQILFFLYKSAQLVKLKPSSSQGNSFPEATH